MMRDGKKLDCCVVSDELRVIYEKLRVDCISMRAE